MATATITINSNQNDGFLTGLHVVYASANALTQGTYVNWNIIVGQYYNNTNSSAYEIARGATIFDTSLLGNASVNGATAQLYLYGPGGKVINNPASTTAWSVVMQNGMPTYPHNPITATDFNRTNYSGTGASLPVSACTEGAYNNYVFNSTGLGWINTTGDTKLVWRSSRDINSIAPTPSGSAFVTEYLYYLDEQYGSEGQRPKLVINYTIGIPSLATSDVTNIGSTSAVGNHYIYNFGGSLSTITHGVCYKQYDGSVPTTANSTAGVTDNPTLLTIIPTNITGLSIGTQYSVRGFAINEAGVAYGGVINFTTISIVSPTVTLTKPVAHLSSTGVSVTGNITNLGGASATTRGFCYATATTPTTASMTAGAAGSFGTGAFTYNITGISASTLYHCRSFAINSAGVGYSSTEVHFDVESQSSTVGIKTLNPNKKVGIKQSTKFGLTASTLKSLSFIRKISIKTGLSLVRQGGLVFQRVLTALVGIKTTLGKLSLTRKFSTTLGVLSSIIKNAGIKRSLLTQVGAYTKGFWSGYNYCKIVTINPSTDGALSSYPMKLTIHRTTGVDTTSDVYVGSECAFDYSDIRFDTVEGVVLYYWVESFTDNEAIVWIEVINIPASPTTTSVRFYYGSTITSNKNNGINTFPFFDDFSSGLSKWVVDSGCSVIGEELVVQSTASVTNSAYSNTSFGTNYALRARLKSAHINTSSNVIEDVSLSSTADGHGVGVSYSSYYSAYNNTYYNLYFDGNSNIRTYVPVSGWSADTYHIQDIIRNGATNNKFYIDNLNYVSVTGVDTDSHPIRFFTVNNTAKLTVDWVLIRPYTSNEPSFGIWEPKATTAGSPFKNYLLKTYYSLNPQIGLIATKIKGFIYKFALIKMGLVTSVERLTSTIKSFTNKIGLKSDVLYDLSFIRNFNTLIEVTSNVHRSIYLTLSSALGFISNISYLHAYTLITSMGLVPSLSFNKGWGIILETILGIFSSVRRNQYAQLTTLLGLNTILDKLKLSVLFITSIGLMSTIAKIIQFNRVLHTVIAALPAFTRLSTTVLFTRITLLIEMVPKSGGRVREFITSLGIISTSNIRIGRILTTFIGIISSFNKTVALFKTFQTNIMVALVGDTRVFFEETLQTLIGVFTDFDLHFGGKVRFLSTSIGIVAEVFRNTYWEHLTTSIGVLPNLARKEGRVFVTMLGLLATTRINIGRALMLSTVLGIAAFITRRRDDIETLSTKFGMKASNLSSILFGNKRFKSLKFLDPKTSANKKLRIKK